MLRIGFSQKYFTLWDVQETTEFKSVDGLLLPYQKVSFTYIQNLSIDEKQAKRKAIFKGVENFEVDSDLYGRNTSFFNSKELFSKIPSDKSFFFEFGKLKGQKINDCNDFNYLFWFFNESQNINAKKRLLENGFEDVNGQIVHAEHAKKIKLRSLVCCEIDDKKEIEAVVLSNLDSENVLKVSFKNEVFFVFWKVESKQFFYKGFDYYLPIIDGKAKKIKGKNVKIKITKDGLNFDYIINELKIL